MIKKILTVIIALSISAGASATPYTLKIKNSVTDGIVITLKGSGTVPTGLSTYNLDTDTVYQFTYTAPKSEWNTPQAQNLVALLQNTDFVMSGSNQICAPGRASITATVLSGYFNTASGGNCSLDSGNTCVLDSSQPIAIIFTGGKC